LFQKLNRVSHNIILIEFWGVRSSRKGVSRILFLLLLIGLFGLALDVRSVSAQGETVYINSDGSVSPFSAPISTVDNVTYKFTGNINYPTYSGVVVERNNIVILGNWHTVQGNQEGDGLSLTDVNNVTIENVNIKDFTEGIYLVDSNNNVINRNNAAENTADGILLWASSDNTVSGNLATGNGFEGIWLLSSSGNVISSNSATANGANGIWLDSASNNNIVSGNTVTGNSQYGIALESSSDNVLSGNVIENNEYNFGVFVGLGPALSDFMNSVDTSNLVNGKPVYYLTSESNLVITPANYPDIGYLAFVNCTNMTAQGFTLTNNGQGILLAFTNDSRITNNKVANNDEEGIELYSSLNNTVSGNTATANGFEGISLDSSSNYNTINGNSITANSYGIVLQSSSYNSAYHNSLIGNVVQASADSASIGNAWDNGYPSGGNYWSDYFGTDLYSGPYQNVTGSDGIGDTPYVIDWRNMDHYPLMKPYLLSVNVWPASVTIDFGLSQSFNSTTSDGTSPYSYQWYLNGTAWSGATSPTWTFTPSSTGNYQVTLNVTDSLGLTAQSNIASVTINQPPNAAISPTLVVIDAGQSQTFNSTVSGGTPPYSYQWFLNGTAVSGATSTTGKFTPASAGSYTVYLNVTDSANATAISNNAIVTVNMPLSTSMAPNSATVDMGQSQNFTSSVSGGTSPFTYQWYLNGSAVQGATAFTWTFSPNSTGFYNVYLNVTDSVGYVAGSNVASITINPQLSVNVLPNLVVMDVGQSQTFNSTVSGGTGSYSYQWYLDGSPVPGATNANWTYTPSTTGFHTIYVNVTDSLGAQAMSNTVNVTVNIHDVAVTSVKPLDVPSDSSGLLKTVIGRGYCLDVNVTVADLGNYTETFNVTVYANTTYITSQNITLSSGASTTLALTWNTTGFAYGNYTTSAYAWPVTNETNTANNNCTGCMMKVSIPGDINGDFKVDLSDLVLLSKAYNSGPGDARWNPNADFKGEDWVGLSDLIIMAKHYNQSVP
jgi:parallel beta-helix repeat protein